MPPAEFNSVKKSNHNWLWMVIVLLVLAGAYFSVQYISNRPSPKPVQQSNNVDFSKPSEQSIPIVKSTLLARAQFTFPDIATTTQISSIKNLPAVFSVFISADNTDLQLKVVKYTGGKSGYSISYLVNQGLFDFYTLQSRNLRSDKDFNVVNSMRANIFGFTELENKNYQIRAEYSLISDKNISVVVQILSK